MFSSLLKLIRRYKNKRRLELINSLLFDMKIYSKTKEKVESKFTLRNCTFHFQCTKTWESLEDINIPNTKSCNVCNQWVRFVDTDKKLAQAIKNNHCVAIKKPAHKSHLIGMLAGANYDEPAFKRKNNGKKKANN